MPVYGTLCEREMIGMQLHARSLDKHGNFPTTYTTLPSDTHSQNKMEVRVRVSDRLLKYLSHILLFCLTCAIVYGINPQLITSLEGHKGCINMLPFALLFIASYVGSEVASFIFLPKVLGMIVAGIVVRNTTDLRFDLLICSLLRNIALTAILLEGGLGLDLAKVARSSGTALSLCFVPLLTDVVVMGILSFFVLGLPYVWSFMMGFILSAACAGIIVPFMIQVGKRGLGTEKAIPTIVLTAASMDDVIAISGFGIMMGFAFPGPVDEGSEIWTYARGPVEILCGIGIGLTYGSFIGILPMETLYKEDHWGRGNLMRTSLLLIGGLGSVFFFDRMDLRGAGPLSALTLALFAASRFRKNDVDVEQLSTNIHVIWSLTSPLFFALIGTEADLRQDFFHSDNQLMACIGVVVVGMMVRVLATFVSLSCSNLNFKEKIYISIVWLAKAAVQATVAPIALDVARDKGLKLEIGYAMTIVVVSLIAILISAPISTLAMTLLADVCLKQRAV